MKVWLVALNAYRGLVRSRALLIFGFIVLMTFLGALGALYFATRLSEAGAAQQSQLLFARQIESLLDTYVVFAFILAVLTGVSVLPGEIKTGTVVPTLGRALPRGQYLLGLFLGMNLLLGSYLGFAAVAVGALFVWSGLWPSPHLFLGVLYAVLVAELAMGLAFLYSTRLGPVVAVIATNLTLTLPGMSEAVRLYSQVWAERLHQFLTYLLPAWELLDYADYLVLSRSPVPRPWHVHLLGVVHAVDYLAVLLLFAYLLFRRRSLLPPA